MKSLLRGVAMTAIMAAALPAWAQTNPSAPSTQSNEQIVPATGGASKPGAPGVPGSTSGATVSPSSGTSTPEPSASAPKSQDESGVRGLPGSKSGDTVNKSGVPELGLGGQEPKH